MQAMQQQRALAGGRATAARHCAPFGSVRPRLPLRALRAVDNKQGARAGPLLLRIGHRAHRVGPGPAPLTPSLAPARADTQVEDGASTSQVDLGKEVTRFSRQAAGTFAPRPSTASKNPAVKGSVLYNVFEYQAWISLVVGGLLSFNIIWPTDEPDIPRLLG
jgi:hypothetical protein